MAGEQHGNEEVRAASRGVEAGQRGTGWRARIGVGALSALAALGALGLLGAATAPTLDSPPDQEWVAEEQWGAGDGDDQGAEVAFWTDPGANPPTTAVTYVYVVGTIENKALDPPAKVLAVYKYEVVPDEFEPGEYAAAAFFPPDPDEAVGTSGGVGIIVDSTRDAIYVTGYTTYEPDGDPGDDFNYVTIKFDVNLDPAEHEDAWEDVGAGDGVRIYDGPVSGSDKAVDVGLEVNTGDVFVTGTSAGDGTGQDIASVRYEGETGDLSDAWPSRSATEPDGVRRYDNGSDETAHDDSAVELATGYVANVDEPAGAQLFVVGTSFDDDTGWDLVTIKYDTGGHDTYNPDPPYYQFGWVHRFDAGYQSSDVATGIDVTYEGNVTGVVSVCGYSVIPPASLAVGGGGYVLTIVDDTDYTVYTLDPQDGAYFWSSPGWRHYNGFGGQYGNDDYSADIDAFGSIQNHHYVCVTGRVRHGQEFDAGTVVYDNGTEDWSHEFDFNDDDDRATAIVADGYLYVGGFLSDYQAPYDYMLLRYTIGSNDPDWVVFYDHNDELDVDVGAALGITTGYAVLTGRARSTNPDFVTINWDLP